MFLIVLTIIMLFFAVLCWAALQADKKMVKHWNDGKCPGCKKGKLVYRDEATFEDVGRLFNYECTSCENVEVFLRRFDK